MNNVVRRIKMIREVKKLHRQSSELHDQFMKVMERYKGCDIRAANIALIMTAALTLNQIDDQKLKLAMQEKFLKTYVKATKAPFTFYKLGH